MANRSATSEVPEALTMSVREFCRLAGVGEDVVRQELAAGRLPHRTFGRRKLIRILRGPALASLGYSADGGDGPAA